MLKAINMSRYSHGTSLAHRLDPRTKIILTLLFMAAVFLSQSFPTLLILLLLTLTLAKLVGKPFRNFLRGLKPILWLALFTVVINTFFIPGFPLSESGILRHVSREGLTLSEIMILRLILLVSATSLLTYSTSPLAMTDGLEKLMKPLNRIGVPVHEIAMMMAIALRFMPVVVEEAEKLIKAQSSRFATFNTGSLWQRATHHLPLVVPLFVGVIKRGDALATAMEARCYRGGCGRTRMRPMEFSGADIACGVAMLIVLIVLMLIEVRPF
ncbi:MAG: energy-coupling factor transporter transmembrane component T [Desulfuromonadaceae bacterium]|nr:energy-coupling factor transporter transmembrane component T [Desulfuromonadaceae bacterium]MDD5106222.1 energy-coupling factor transporter transmembrane component T [Desulfuromonadaceae bacterium]